MEFEYSPSHHSPLLSPSRGHTFDHFASIREIRKSLSRSPSKPARFQIITTTRGQPPSAPSSPSQLSQNTTLDGQNDINTRKVIPKRNVSVRSSSRKISPNTPLRRALSDNANQANISPKLVRRLETDTEQENMDKMKDMDDNMAFDDLKSSFPKARQDSLLQPVLNEHAAPKSSPLKRSDGVMNLSRAKRRSVHGTSWSDFNIFESYDGPVSPATAHFDDEQAHHSPSVTSSPHRRPLRKSTIQQRNMIGRARLFEDTPLSPALTRARSRMSLDTALPMHSADVGSPLRRGEANQPPVLFAQPCQRLYQSAPKPHPLSNALTPSSSTSSIPDATNNTRPEPTQQDPPQMPPPFFSKSLPIGSMRPMQDEASEDSYATPAAYRMAKPLPQAFMSTGLISKRNRNVDVPGTFGAGPMPDTPSKKVHSHVAPTPFNAPNVEPVSFTPTTPVHPRQVHQPAGLFRSSNIFAAPQATINRRGSFVGIEEFNHSPPHQLESQSSTEEFPPTPTKSMNAGSRPQSKGKSNSLRSSIFGRRTSLAADTFLAPGQENGSPPQAENAFDIPAAPKQKSPHTPSDSYTPPDASKLSISAEHRSSTLFPSNSFPPATPTAPRDGPFNASLGQSFASSGYFANDHDTALTSRFSTVTTFGVGEFSQVYKVSGAIARTSSPQTANLVWAVKKSRKPYIGLRDRQRKMQEVQILQQLRGQEHVIELVDSWESRNHLYIQTQFCENGNLKDFLTQTGFKGRLDDFRIWKILLELSQGVRSIHAANIIHLDIKPANVFIDWEGVLKIGDFGLATSWPASNDIDGEGDREYIGPEVLSGHFDKPADIFSLGMVMLEIAGNIVLPDNGKSWQRLRAGDMSDLPSLTWSSNNSLDRDQSGTPVSNGEFKLGNAEMSGDLDLSFLHSTIPDRNHCEELVVPPNFMVDANDEQALDKVVQWMIAPNPHDRPVVEQLLTCGGVLWVEGRRRAGATVFEGAWGPANEVLATEQDVEMIDI